MPSQDKDSNAILIVNNASRRGQEAFDQAVEALTKHGLKLSKTLATKNSDEIEHAVAQGVAEGIPTIIVGGGDGTLGSIIGNFVGKESALAILPLGTGNSFARDLGIPDVEAAAKIAATGKNLQIDVGQINGRYFINVATVGLSTLIADELTTVAKKRFGKLVYAVALARALRKLKAFKAELVLPSGSQQFRTLQVVVGVGRFHAGPFPLSPGATITDGQLNVYALEETSRWSLFKYACHLPGGHHVAMKEVSGVKTESGLLSTTPIQRVTVDGEVSLETPIKFGIVPASVRVKVSQDFSPLG